MLSLITSGLVVVLTFFLGLPVAYFLATKNFPGKSLLDALIEIPIVMPPLVTGLALLTLFNNNGMVGGILQKFDIRVIFTRQGIIIAQFVVASPFFIKTMRESIAAIPKNLFDASTSLCASKFYTLRRMILPMCKNGMIAGLLLTWARALGEFGATSMVAGCVPQRTETMTLAIYMEAMGGELLSAKSVALILTGLSFLAIVLIKKIFTKSETGRKE